MEQQPLFEHICSTHISKIGTDFSDEKDLVQIMLYDADMHIMCEMMNISPELSYEERVAFLTDYSEKLKERHNVQHITGWIPPTNIVT